MDSSISEMQMGVVNSVGFTSGHPVSQQFPASNNQTSLVSDNCVSQRFQSIDMQMGQIDSKGYNTLQSQKLVMSQSQTGQIGSMTNNVEQMSTPFKRKAPMEPISQNCENMSMPQKRVAEMQHRPWLQQMSTQNKRTVQLESVPNSPGSQNSPMPSKKVVRTDSLSSKSGSQRVSSQKNQTARVQPPTKGSTESSESVRSKMREQLAAAFSLVAQQGNKPSNMQNNSPGEDINSLRTKGNDEPAAAAADAIDSVTKESNTSVESFSAQKNHDGHESHKILADARTGGSTLASICDRREFRSSNVLSYDDVPFSENFFVKDELLQGNGLSWVLDSDLDMAEQEIENAGEPKSDHEELGGNRVEQAYQSPENLALKIEAELFKLFGGVNKKYKEKGRSLLFNLKDRNNPELRERVMAGEISPERLCSMTAEELASKELSQWRMAKAEELAQMVVLPDSDVDMRRLVKKTHKGEFQVEVEQDDNIPVDISGGLSSHARSRPKSKEMETPTSKPVAKKEKANASGDNSNLEGHNTKYTLTIPPNEETDFMHGLMVDDGLKDVEFLPPIVSLDEFMESLDSEPPFENLPLDSERVTPVSDKDDSEAGSGAKPSAFTWKDVVDSSTKKHGNVDVTPTKTDADVKSDDSRLDSKLDDGYSDVKSRDYLLDVKSSDSLKTETTVLSGIPKGERVWGGSLQLTISSTADVVCIFKSGEKTSAIEWPGFIEIKGRVRLEAFEKFLQELPLSRSRAVMVVHVVLKESENERAALQEVADSYILDERVGFAEPASGVEFYFCPTNDKTLEMLGKIIQKEHIEALNETDNGLIGVIVWRKLSSISPKSSSSHHKHASKKQHLSSRKQQDSPVNSNFAPKSAPPLGPPLANSRPLDDDDEDDIPPGFGPPAARDEDDLPEFKFSGGSNPPMSHFSLQKQTRGSGVATFRAPQTSRPVEQVRELIHKYGQNNATALPGNWKDKGLGGVAAQPWNDDDDDIPEWQPQAPPQQGHNFPQQMLQLHLVNHANLVSQQQAHQGMLPLQSRQPPIINATNGSENPVQWQQHQQQGTWWVPSAQAGGVRPSSVGCQPDVGQFYGAPGHGPAVQPGVPWQQNVPKSRGF